MGAAVEGSVASRGTTAFGGAFWAMIAVGRQRPSEAAALA